MFKLFNKPKPKPKPLTRAERRERMMQKLRAMHPDWSDAKLKAFAVAQLVTEPQRQQQAKRAQYDAELAALVADGDKLLARMEANASATRAVLARDTRGATVTRLAPPQRIERAYSVVRWAKSVDGKADRVTILGTATTPTPDRYGDVVEPMGAKFALPLPLLWQHNAAEPIGSVVHVGVRPTGIAFKAEIPTGASGVVGERIQEALQSIEHGLVRGVSIGFRALPEGTERNQDGSFHFREWEWLELSLVTIPANAEATIATVKQFATA
jgi:uncharacterized protein